MTEKLVKEFEKIRTSLAKSKKLVLSDIDKIDEKYRKLAQEEKKSLTESLAVLNEQLKYYDKMLNGEPIVEEASDENAETEQAEEAPKEEKEAIIEDTIFPENNEPEETKEEKPVDLDAEEDAEWDEKIQSGEIKEVKSDIKDTFEGWPESVDEKKQEEEPVPVITTDDNDWPIPEDWK